VNVLAAIGFASAGASAAMRTTTLEKGARE
jgi:hypothetical protein